MSREYYLKNLAAHCEKKKVALGDFITVTFDEVSIRAFGRPSVGLTIIQKIAETAKNKDGVRYKSFIDCRYKQRLWKYFIFILFYNYNTMRGMIGKWRKK